MKMDLWNMGLEFKPQTLKMWDCYEEVEETCKRRRVKAMSHTRDKLYDGVCGCMLDRGAPCEGTAEPL